MTCRTPVGRPDPQLADAILDEGIKSTLALLGTRQQA
jgi:hypothetical protein